jgi:predicted phage terminase large subunit-like protein
MTRKIFRRKVGDALHPEHESHETLERIRQNLGAYNFAGQYQQAPAPLGGGMIKAEWFKYGQPPETFDRVIQSWDTASVAAELNSYSVCITLGTKGKNIYVLHVLRKRMNFPELKRAVRGQAQAWRPNIILIEDKASGIQLIQESVAENVRGITKYKPEGGDKIMRMHAQTATIENGLVYLPREAPWLDEYLHELITFPKGKYDDQVDATAQALDWLKGSHNFDGWIEFYRGEAEKAQRYRAGLTNIDPPESLRRATLRAPGPYLNYYVSAIGGRAGQYSSGPDGLIQNVHPEDIDSLIRAGCFLP